MEQRVAYRREMLSVKLVGWKETNSVSFFVFFCSGDQF